MRSLFSAVGQVARRGDRSSSSCASKGPFTIAVEGNIGAGKSTFMKPFMLQHGDKVHVVKEPVHLWRDCKGHNLLSLMYEDPRRWSFALQSYIQLTMARNYSQAKGNKPIRMMERSLLSARYCFVENLYNRELMSDSEYSVLSEWFNYLVTDKQLNLTIDHIVYLRTRPEVAFRRIAERGRVEEQALDLGYLQALHDLHEDWLIRRTKFQPLPAPVTVIDANKDIDSLLPVYNRFKEGLLARLLA